ncbi:hypothetical protein PHLCEN_2v2173 [Hermanssonia centrifuga]|uniref:Type 1 phosphatases regulator n=1 Tax=Hermanssonia centrifuga TaxID=98765 RepID=A0A2R6RPX4_9APHY|nr:hypothetical protein PHLCEN_2v2173 [Hermanssonia centrifuga]
MSYLATRPSTSAPSDGSRTITVLDSQPRDESGAASNDDAVGTLHLRGGPRARTRRTQRVVWREDVVDNEGAGKKSSKICCIYQPPKRFDESSSEESSDSDSDASCSSCDHGGSARRGAGARRQRPTNGSGNGEGSSSRNTDGGGVVHQLHEDSGEKNMYERVPGKKGQGGPRRERLNVQSSRMPSSHRTQDWTEDAKVIHFRVDQTRGSLDPNESREYE